MTTSPSSASSPASTYHQISLDSSLCGPTQSTWVASTSCSLFRSTVTLRKTSTTILLPPRPTQHWSRTVSATTLKSSYQPAFHTPTSLVSPMFTYRRPSNSSFPKIAMAFSPLGDPASPTAMDQILRRRKRSSTQRNATCTTSRALTSRLCRGG